MPARGRTGGTAKPGDPGWPLGWLPRQTVFFPDEVSSDSFANVGSDPECVWLSQVWKGLVPMLDGRGPGPRKPHQARHNPGRGAGDGQWGQGGGGHGRTHGPVEKAPMHTPGPERFGAGCAPLCPLGRDRQASLRLAACFLDDSTSCVLPVRQETAPA